MDDFGVTLVPDATILVEVAVFLIVLTVVSRYVLPRIRSAVAERQRHVSEQLAAAEKAEARAQQTEHQATDALGAARREARRIKAAIDSGSIGPIIDVEEPDGDGVLISVE